MCRAFLHIRFNRAKYSINLQIPRLLCGEFLVDVAYVLAVPGGELSGAVQLLRDDFDLCLGLFGVVNVPFTQLQLGQIRGASNGVTPITLV